MGRFSLDKSLDIVELSAIYASVPAKFSNDGRGKKAEWREGLEKQLKKMMAADKAGLLPPSASRHPAYKDELPFYTGRQSMFIQDTTSSEGAFKSAIQEEPNKLDINKFDLLTLTLGGGESNRPLSSKGVAQPTSSNMRLLQNSLSSIFGGSAVATAGIPGKGRGGGIGTLTVATQKSTIRTSKKDEDDGDGDGDGGNALDEGGRRGDEEEGEERRSNDYDASFDFGLIHVVEEVDGNVAGHFEDHFGSVDPNKALGVVSTQKNPMLTAIAFGAGKHHPQPAAAKKVFASKANQKANATASSSSPSSSQDNKK